MLLGQLIPSSFYLNQPKPDYLFKVLFLGPAKNRFLRLASEARWIMHLTDFVIIRKTLEYRDQTYTIDLQLWDLPGQERFPTIMKAYAKNADAFVIVNEAADANVDAHQKLIANTKRQDSDLASRNPYIMCTVLEEDEGVTLEMHDMRETAIAAPVHAALEALCRELMNRVFPVEVEAIVVEHIAEPEPVVVEPVVAVNAEPAAAAVPIVELPTFFAAASAESSSYEKKLSFIKDRNFLQWVRLTDKATDKDYHADIDRIYNILTEQKRHDIPKFV